MEAGKVWRQVTKILARRHRDAKSFEHELHAAGGMTGRGDIGAWTVPTEKIVGSVSRWQNLRSDFFYKHGQAITGRFVRVGEAMQRGVPLPPVELYKIKGRRGGTVSEYYVVDGHHRVAMARKLGQAFLDAHVVEYKVAGNKTDEIRPAGASADAPTGEASSADAMATHPNVPPE